MMIGSFGIEQDGGRVTIRAGGVSAECEVSGEAGRVVILFRFNDRAESKAVMTADEAAKLARAMLRAVDVAEGRVKP